MTVVEQVSFADLYIHPLNPRLDPPQNEIDALATNIRELGLIQNLAGLRDETGKVGVIAGGRRLRALAQLQDDERFALVPVKLAEDEATAAVWAAAENSQRSALHPADEIREYALLRERGVSDAAIAIAFGVTKAHVKRRLRLAGLPEPVLAALRTDRIGLSEAAVFVLCDDPARIEEVLAQIGGHPGRYSEESIKRLLKAGAVRDTDRRVRFVGVPAYRAAGGRISTDLFGGEVYLDDVAILDACFAARLTEVAEETRARDGWQWVQTTETCDAWAIPNDLDAVVLYPAEGALSEEEAARHDELADRAEAGDLEPDEEAELARLTAILDGDYTPEQRQHAGVVLYVSYAGELRATHGMVLPTDQPAAAEAGIIDRVLVTESEDETEAGPRNDAPKLSEALMRDLRAVRDGARQHAALRQPELLLDLLAFHLSSNIGRAFSLHRYAVNVTPTTETGYAPDPRLLDAEAGRSNATDLAKAFRAFRKRGAEHVREVLTVELARLLDPSDYGSDTLAPVFDKLAKVSPREVWTPTAENFFKRAPGAWRDDLQAAMTEADMHLRSLRPLTDHVARSWIKQVSSGYTPAEGPLLELRCNFADAGTMWIHCGSCFVAVVDKQKAGDDQDEGTYVWNRVGAALRAWHPNFYRLVLSEIQNALELEAVTDHEAWLDDNLCLGLGLYLLESDDAAAGRMEAGAVAGSAQSLIDRFVDLIRRRLATHMKITETATSVLSARLSTALEAPRPGETGRHVRAREMAHVAADAACEWQEKVLPSVNAFMISDEFRGGHITTGSVLRSGESDYWLCVSPACDLEPRETGPVLLQLIRLTKGPSTNKYSTGERIVITTKNGPAVLTALNALNRQPSLKVVLLPNGTGVVREGTAEPVLTGWFASAMGGTSALGPEVVGASPATAAESVVEAQVETAAEPAPEAPAEAGKTAPAAHGGSGIAFTVVAQLRGTFATRFLLAAGQHLSRVGVDFIDL